jgi:hypothetical protein
MGKSGVINTSYLVESTGLFFYNSASLKYEVPSDTDYMELSPS